MAIVWTSEPQSHRATCEGFSLTPLQLARSLQLGLQLLMHFWEASGMQITQNYKQKLHKLVHILTIQADKSCDKACQTQTNHGKLQAKLHERLAPYNHYVYVNMKRILYKM